MSKAKPRQDYLDDPQIQEIIQDIVQPYLNKKDPIIRIQIGVAKGKETEWREAIGFISAYNTYSTTKVGRFTQHRIDLKRDQAWDIFQIYQMVEKSPHLEIFIDGMRLPYAATLWLPLLWFYL